jgi:hypothetical protein
MARNPWANWPFGGIGSTSRQQPLSGDVSQWLRIFSPTVTVNGSGTPDLEGEIVRDVATYGSQLGQISAIVLALAKNKGAPVEAVSKLQKIVDEVEKKKLEYQRNAADRARKALEDLREHDPAVFASVLSEFRPGGSHAAPPPIAPPVEA